MTFQPAFGYQTETAQVNSTLYFYQRVNGVLTDATTVTLADAATVYGVLRLDTRAVIVASGAATTHLSTGVYTYTPPSGLDPRYVYFASWKVVNTWGTTYTAQIVNPPGVLATRGQIRAAAARLMGLLIAEGTTTAANSNSITDASVTDGGLKTDSDSTHRFNGTFCLMTTGPGAGTWREVSSDNYIPSSGQLVMASGWDSARLPTSTGGDQYEVYAGLTPNQWSLRDNTTLVDMALLRCRYARRSPLTLILDGDMETPGTLAWTASNSSIAKTVIDTVTSGAQALLVVNSVAGGYAQSTAQPVIPGHGYSAVVDYRCAGLALSTASLVVWDSTNNALIATGIDQDAGINFEAGRSSVSFTAPSNCYSVVYRLTGTESTAAIAWDDLIVVTAGRRRYQSPSWIINRNQIDSYIARDGSRPFEDKWQDVGWPKDIQEDPSALATFVVDMPLVAGNRPVYATGECAYGPMTGTADGLPTSCPLEWGSRSAARVAWQAFSREIEFAATTRAVVDRSVVEFLAVQADNMYMPVHESSFGLPEGYTTEILHLP